MKAIKLIVKNIGIVADAAIELNKPLIIFYGEIRQGKTTLLNAVKWVFGGAFPTDIIRKGETEASITLFLDCGTITRSFYVARDGSTKARPVIFKRNGAAVEDPVAEIKKLLNPFLLNNLYLINMPELERKKYFVSQFAVDTSGLDNEITVAEALASATRSKLKGYGEIDLTPVEPPPDITKLRQMRADIINEHDKNIALVQAQMAKLRADHQTAVDAVNTAAAAARENNWQRAEAKKKVASFQTDIIRLERELATARDGAASYGQWLDEHPAMDLPPLPPAPDLTHLAAVLMTKADTRSVDDVILQSEADKVRYEQFLANQKRAEERAKDEAQIKATEATIRELRTKRLAKLKECSEKCGIPGLEFDEAGNFSYQGTQAGMLSTAQLMTLSSQLSALYPDGFGLDLIDRAESLGKSIFAFVDRAKAENKTILAAVVGEKPADVPEEVGVFVVEQGVVK